ncbi:hypothetical protein GCM10023231_02080 [Olivibacter ginsenosidimutans]|uniref:FAD-binding FR-type domain-containing protein n=1 Tax=Olivibacter ginsenosidimutans TaxID=1176537 RepID=A0ABP9AE80_9SPHI
MNIIKKKIVSVLERKMIKTARVLAIRYWYDQSMVEIDLHVPDMKPADWTSVQHMKIKVAEGTYRDYSPTMWDIETKTCSLIIDTSHDGRGAHWALQLNSGDLIEYLGIGSTGHRYVEKQPIICIGDESSLAHFIALMQLIGKDNELKGTIGFSNPNHLTEYQANIRAPFVPLPKDVEVIKQWIISESPKNHLVYIAGSYQLVSEMKRFVRNVPGFRGTIKGQGFWK